MDFRKFNRVLRNIVCKESIDSLRKQMDREEGGEEPNLFLAQRWISMDENCLQDMADIQVKSNKLLTAKQTMAMMYHCIEEEYDFRPRYIKKLKKT